MQPNPPNPFAPFAPPVSPPIAGEPQKHSGLGIASFVLAMLVGAATFLLLVTAGVLTARSPNQQLDENSSVAVVLGLAIFGAVFAALVGGGLAVAGLVQRDRKRVFAVLGLVFNGLLVVGTGLLVLIGLAS